MICSNEKQLFDFNIETAKLAEIPWPDTNMDPELISETGLFDYDQKPLLYIQYEEIAYLFHMSKTPSLVFSGPGTLESFLNGRVIINGSVYQFSSNNDFLALQLIWKADDESDKPRLVSTAAGPCIRFSGESEESFNVYVKQVVSIATKHSQEILDTPVEMNQFGRSTHFELLVRGHENEAERESAKIAEIAWLTQFSLRRLE